MPSSSEMKTAMQCYIDTYNSGDADAVAALYADNATIEDPVGTPLKSGRAEIRDFYRFSISTGAKLSLDTAVRGSHGNSAAMAFTATIGEMQVKVIDVMTFDEDLKFTSMRAFFGPDDFRP